MWCPLWGKFSVAHQQISVQEKLKQFSEPGQTQGLSELKGIFLKKAENFGVEDSRSSMQASSFDR